MSETNNKPALLAGNQPIEQRADRGQMLFDRRLRHRFLQALDVSRDMQAGSILAN
jgi:hypothetical protein